VKRAFVTGISGQDGAYLAQFLLGQGYQVFGGERRGSSPNNWRLKALGIHGEVELVPFELADDASIYRAIEVAQPDEIYNLAAQSFVPVSFQQPCYTGDVNGSAVARILEAIRHLAPECRFYQASSSEMFGLAHETPQRETTPFHPRSPYAAAKAYAHYLTVNYREAYGLHASCGIAFNHESPLRGAEFVTKKIVVDLARIHRGDLDCLRLGNLDARRDWGFAGDYVKGMWQMLQQSGPEDYILATGETHSIREFVEWACAVLDWSIEWTGEGGEERGIETSSGRMLVAIDPALYRPSDVPALLGDATKARETFGWQPLHTAGQIAFMMMDHELSHV